MVSSTILLMKGGLDWLLQEGLEGSRTGELWETKYTDSFKRSKTVRKRERCSPHSPAQSGARRFPLLLSSAAPGAVRDECTNASEWMEGLLEGCPAEHKEEGRRVVVFGLVISSHNLPSGAGVHWLVDRPEVQRACVAPLTRRRSGPDCHLGCSGRFS